MVPFEAIAIPLYNVATMFGMVDTYAGMVVPAIADGLVTFLFIQFFKDIPPSLIEAARVDGAKWPTIFTKIIVPISVPVFITAGLMIFMNQWNSYLWPLMVTNKTSMRTVQVGITMLNFADGNPYGPIMAASMVVIIPSFLIFLFFRKQIVAGMMAGGVKG